jgi:hypothetical protein
MQQVALPACNFSGNNRKEKIPFSAESLLSTRKHGVPGFPQRSFPMPRPDIRAEAQGA